MSRFFTDEIELRGPQASEVVLSAVQLRLLVLLVVLAAHSDAELRLRRWVGAGLRRGRADAFAHVDRRGLLSESWKQHVSQLEWRVASSCLLD